MADLSAEMILRTWTNDIVCITLRYDITISRNPGTVFSNVSSPSENKAVPQLSKSSWTPQQVRSDENTHAKMSETCDRPGLFLTTSVIFSWNHENRWWEAGAKRGARLCDRQGRLIYILFGQDMCFAARAEGDPEKEASYIKIAHCPNKANGSNVLLLADARLFRK